MLHRTIQGNITADACHPALMNPYKGRYGGNAKFLEQIRIDGDRAAVVFDLFSQFLKAVIRQSPQDKLKRCVTNLFPQVLPHLFRDAERHENIKRRLVLCIWFDMGLCDRLTAAFCVALHVFKHLNHFGIDFLCSQPLNPILIGLRNLRNKIGKKEYYAIASFKALPALNCGTLDAAIFKGAPVLGLRPVRA